MGVFPSGLLARRNFLKRSADFDGVLLHKKGVNPLDAHWLCKYSNRIIYNYDDAVMYSDREPDRNSRTHLIRFRRSVKLADMVIAGSSYLAEHAKGFNSNVIVLPIGLKVSDYKIQNRQKNDRLTRLVWVGSKSTLGYLDDIRPVLERVGESCNNVILRIIADDFIDLENMKVEKCPWEKNTRGMKLASCDIGLAPLPDNRFTKGKCSFKVLEYSAAGLPVVASPIGTNTDFIRENITGFLVSDMDGWFNRIKQLIEDKSLRERMGRNGA
ncbi:MAG: glycosyltransferase family 4 protein, partial [Planctomycetes bacterium]|nr:glycosyltransferase family 4 protein [Planctomycetota bacterium]